MTSPAVQDAANQDAARPLTSAPAAAAGVLNESQRIRLVATCQHVERMLCEVEHAFGEAQSSSPFSRHVDDLTSAQQRLVREYATRIRARLIDLLAVQGLMPTHDRIGLRHWLLTGLAFLDMTVDELRPRYMAGFGELSAQGVVMLDGIVEELHDAIAQVRACLAPDPGQDLEARLRRLESDRQPQVLLLAELIDRYGLVEYRTPLLAIIDALERGRLELALFGRVNTGKSSLLNRLLECDVLPVGIEPLTAVPTRMQYGSKARLCVECAGEAARELELAQLIEYASEQRNPGNCRRVVRLTCELPAPSLRSGVILVDTPGFGAVTAGAGGASAQTLSYLPYCDVAAVLVDANSTLTAEDAAIIRALLTCGIEVTVLLSKADLLGASERDTAARYLAAALQREFDRALTVILISARGTELFDTWRRQWLEPLLARQQESRRQSAARKLMRLQGRVEAALQSLLEHGRGAPGAPNETRSAAGWITILQEAAARLGTTQQYVDDLCPSLRQRASDLLGDISRQVVDGQPMRAVLEQSFTRTARQAAEAVAEALRQLIDVLRHAARGAGERFAEQLRGAQVRGSDVREFIGEFEIAVELREVPLPELPHNLQLPRIGRRLLLLGKGIARAAVERQLRRTLEPQIIAALDAYAAVLRRWAHERLDRIRGSWMVLTDALRAQSGGGLSDTRSFGTAEREQIRADLERLSRS